MNILCQRDTRWKDVTLGTKGTIGDYGCTITCLSMAANLTPDQTNERLNRVGGYANGNLVIWSKIKEAIPWMEFGVRGYSYDNEKVLSAIDKNGFCLVEVDGSRIGGTKHWVLYIGGGQMYDPWYGTQKTTSYYPPLGYAVVNKIAEPESTIYRSYDLSNRESMKICVDDHIKIVEGQFVEKTLYESIKGQLTKSEEHVESLSNQLGTANSTIASQLKKIESQITIIDKFNDEDAVQIKQLRESYEKETKANILLWDTINEWADILKYSVGSDDAQTTIAGLTGALQSQLRAKVSPTQPKPIVIKPSYSVIIDIIKKLFGGK